MRWIVPLLLAIAPVQTLHATTAETAPADRLSYILMSSDGSSVSSGSSDDFRIANRYRSGGAPMLYVRDQGIGWLIRDRAILSRAEAIMAPQRELGRRQGELGAQQGQLGGEQGKLGAEQGRLGALMANARVREMGVLGRQMGELGRKQAALGEQQAELGRLQAALGRHPGRLAQEAQPKLRALVAEAVRRGVAQRVD
jgi:hypothetical protein